MNNTTARNSLFGAVAVLSVGVASAGAAITPTLLTSGEGYDSTSPNTYTANLTTLGTTDWIQWGGSGSTSPVRKLTGGGLISGAARVNTAGDAIAFSAAPDGAPTLSWTDGSPVLASAGSRSGILTGQTFGFGQGLTFSVPATGTAQTLTVFTGTYNANYTLTAQLFEAGTPVGTATTTNVVGRGYRDGFAAIRYDFSGTSAQTLQFSVVTTSRDGEFSESTARLYGAALSNAAPAVVPEAGAGLLSLLGVAAFGAGMIVKRRM